MHSSPSKFCLSHDDYFQCLFFFLLTDYFQTQFPSCFSILSACSLGPQDRTLASPVGGDRWGYHQPWGKFPERRAGTATCLPLHVQPWRSPMESPSGLAAWAQGTSLQGLQPGLGLAQHLPWRVCQGTRLKLDND